MKRYISIFLNFLRNNTIRELEFRENFIFLTGLGIFWVFFQVFIVQIMFQYTDSLFGWTKYEIFFLVGFFRIVKSLMDTFVRPNFLRFPDMITKGELDFVLTKPLNSIFLVSFRHHSFNDSGDTIGGIFILLFSMSHLGIHLTLETGLTFVLGIILSFIVFYSICFMFTTLAIFIPRLTALKPFYDLINYLSRSPGDVFTRGRVAFEILFLPLLLISTIPVKIILGQAPQYLFILEVVGAIVLLITSIKFWNYSIKRYSSASS